VPDLPAKFSPAAPSAGHIEDSELKHCEHRAWLPLPDHLAPAFSVPDPWFSLLMALAYSEQNGGIPVWFSSV
jgi:hypothetical protein